MDVLAVYALVLIVFSCCVIAGDHKSKLWMRIVGILIYFPALVFLAEYLFG